MPAERVLRWDRGVDTARFDPALREPVAAGSTGDQRHVLRAHHAREGRRPARRRVPAAREREPRLHLVLAGGGPEQERLRERLGDRATFLGWLQGDDLARAYASADMFLFPSATDTFGQVILEAQASGLPVRRRGPRRPAVADRAPRERPAVRARRRALADGPARARRLAAAARAPRRGGAARGARARTWERALERLAAGYGHALGRGRARPARAPAADAERERSCSLMQPTRRSDRGRRCTASSPRRSSAAR